MALGQRLITRIAVGPLASGVTTTLAHGLREHDRDVSPNTVWPDRATPIVAVSVTDTTVTFRNDGFFDEVAIFEAIRWHTIQEKQDLLIPAFLWKGNASATSEPDFSFLPEAWERQDVGAGLSDDVVQTTVTTLFDEFEAVRAGSFTGLTTRLTEAVTAGILTVKISLNGAATAFTQLHTSILNPSGGRTTLAPGVINFVAGDQIGVLIDTTAGFLPNSTDLLVRVETSV